MKSPVIIIISAIAAILVIGATTYYLLKKPTLPIPSIKIPTAQPSPTTIPTTTTEAPTMSFEQKIDRMRQAISDVSTRGIAREVILTFTEAEANEQVIKMLGQTKDLPLEIKSVRVDFQPDNNLLTEIEASGFGARAKVKSKVGVKDGKPNIDITDISLGIIPLPDSVKQSLADMIRQKTTEVITQLSTAGLTDAKVDIVFTSIRTQEQDMTVTVLVQPKA